ncbi:MAG: twin-arginine translocase subunit TatC [Chromatiaceae bacterium]|nr:twin-arginine translocase subunit TatC [Chromatiaceae bacterium]
MLPSTHPDEPGAEQPFVSHLIELRDRLLRMLVAVAVVVLALFPFANKLYLFVATPLMARLPEGNTMIATQVAAPFLTPFKLALVAAVFLAMPYLLYQLWAFVAPGLYRHEKRLAVPLLISSILLFYLGMLFAYFVVFPLIFSFLIGTTPEGVAMMTDISAYLDFVLTLFFAFGLAFEIPIATILLISLGLTTPDALASKRPYVIVGTFVVGMLLTPPDVISQTLLAIPMWLLFELGILFSRLLLANATTPDTPPDPASSGDLAPRAAGAASAWTTPSEVELDEFDPPVVAPASGAGINSVEEKLRRANRLRELGSYVAARQVLYEVLEEGDEEERRVARDILAQLDED